MTLLNVWKADGSLQSIINTFKMTKHVKKSYSTWNCSVNPWQRGFQIHNISSVILSIMLLSFPFKIMDFMSSLCAFKKICQEFKTPLFLQLFHGCHGFKRSIKNSKPLLSVVCGFPKKLALLLRWNQRPRELHCFHQSTKQMKDRSEFIHRILSAGDRLLNIYTQKVLGTRKRFLWGLL